MIPTSLVLSVFYLRGLPRRRSFVWILCPQALMVIFFRQAQHSLDLESAFALTVSCQTLGGI
jgi:hypothetical protein